MSWLFEQATTWALWKLLDELMKALASASGRTIADGAAERAVRTLEDAIAPGFDEHDELRKSLVHWAVGPSFREAVRRFVENEQPLDESLISSLRATKAVRRAVPPGLEMTVLSAFTNALEQELYEGSSGLYYLSRLTGHQHRESMGAVDEVLERVKHLEYRLAATQTGADAASVSVSRKIAVDAPKAVEKPRAENLGRIEIQNLLVSRAFRLESDALGLHWLVQEKKSIEVHNASEDEFLGAYPTHLSFRPDGRPDGPLELLEVVVDGSPALVTVERSESWPFIHYRWNADLRLAPKRIARIDTASQFRLPVDDYYALRPRIPTRNVDVELRFDRDVEPWTVAGGVSRQDWNFMTTENAVVGSYKGLAAPDSLFCFGWRDPRSLI